MSSMLTAFPLVLGFQATHAVISSHHLLVSLLT
nr:MAG TPA: hypothetical protein [Caudoviricetes sp.]